MALSTSPCLTMPGPSTLATDASCGTTSGRPRAARTSAIAAWACGITTCSWRRPTIIWSRSMPRPARSDGTSRSPISRRDISPRRPRSSSEIMCSREPATTSMRPDSCSPSIPKPGDLQWKFYTVPMNPGDPGAGLLGHSSTQRGMAAPSLGSGRVRSGNASLYFRHRQPDAGLHHRHARRRRQPVHLRDCGGECRHRQMAWYFSTSPHDMHDYDSAQTPVLVDGMFNGKMRKLVLTAARNGYWFTLDRITGERLVTTKYGLVDQLGQGPEQSRRAVARSGKGCHGRRFAGFADLRRHHQLGAAVLLSGHRIVLYGGRRRVFDLLSHRRGSARLDGVGRKRRSRRRFRRQLSDRIDYRTGKVTWRHPFYGNGGGGGLLTTAGKLLFAADGAGNLVAYDAATGKPLWNTRIGNVTNRSADLYARRPPICDRRDRRYALVVRAVLVACRRALEVRRPMP